MRIRVPVLVSVSGLHRLEIKRLTPQKKNTKKIEAHFYWLTKKKNYSSIFSSIKYHPNSTKKYDILTFEKLGTKIKFIRHENDPKTNKLDQILN